MIPVRLEGVDHVLHQTWKMATPGPVRVVFGAPMQLTGEDYVDLTARVETDGAKIGQLGGVCGTIIASRGYLIAQWTARRRILLKGFRASLSKDDLIDMQGTVVAVHSGGLYRVQCDAGHEVLAQLSGRMRRFRIKVVPGDRVTVGVSPYDPVRGIITFRAR